MTERTPEDVQRELELTPRKPITFDGKTYDADFDKERLKTLLGRVFRFMLDNRWHTLPEIQRQCGGSEASVSARLRDLRKPRFGAHEIERRRSVRGALFEYRLKRCGCTPSQVATGHSSLCVTRKENE